MAAWIVKGQRARNAWDERLIAGTEDDWVTRRPRREFAPGDRVFLWESKPGRKVIALADVVRVRPKNEDGDTFFRLRYTTGHFENAIEMEQLRADSIFDDASFLKAGAAGTIFELTSPQAARMLELVAAVNPDVVQRTLALPTPVVRTVLPFVAESIKRANALAPEKWGVTPRPDGVRLNVGRIEVITLGPHQVRVLVDAGSIPNGLPSNDGYASVPSSRVIAVPISDAEMVLPTLRESHDTLLRLASDGPFNPGSKSGHRDWIVEEIARLTKIHLPLPMHDGSEGTLVSDALEVARDADYFEGGVTRVLVNRYERDPRARAACLRHYGTACFVCGMSFSDIYGPDLDGVIHVHHLEPIHGSGEKRQVDPIQDLRPLCPNCHTAVHRTSPPRTMEQLKATVLAHRHE